MGRAHDRQAQAEVVVESGVVWWRGRAGHTPAQQRAVQGWGGVGSGTATLHEGGRQPWAGKELVVCATAATGQANRIKTDTRYIGRPLQLPHAPRPVRVCASPLTAR